jgi:predicted nuclease of predicted toxin-antitoxin system
VATFHCDHNIPRALAEGLRQRGHTAQRAQDLGMAMAADPEHLLRAARERRLLLTKDHDFVDLHIGWFLWAAAWGLPPQPHAGILIIHDN